MGPESSAQVGVVVRKGLKPAGVLRARKCNLPSCPVFFTPALMRADSGRFCCVSHKSEYWRLARDIGERVLSGQAHLVDGADTALLTQQQSNGGSQSQRVLALLQQFAGEWVDRPYQRLPGVIWCSRIGELRRRGLKIECRRVGRGNYEYRLV